MKVCRLPFPRAMTYMALVTIKGSLDDIFCCVWWPFEQGPFLFFDNDSTCLCTKQSPRKKSGFPKFGGKDFIGKHGSLSSLSSNTFKINWNNRGWKSQVLSLSLPNSWRWMGAIPYFPSFQTFVESLPRIWINELDSTQACITVYMSTYFWSCVLHLCVLKTFRLGLLLIV